MAHGVRLDIGGVCHRYGERDVLCDLDLDVAASEFVAVVGRSGSGKTTLLRLLAGLEVPTQGTILQDGASLTSLNRRARLMFQEARLLPWARVSGNVSLGLSAAHASRVSWALEQVGLGDRAGDWPATLSGGQQQRVALARALAGSPGLLLLDEPLGALDALTRIEMQALVEQVWQASGFTAVLVTHDVEEAVTLADRVVVVDHGRIARAIEIPLPRPRHRNMPRYGELSEEILNHILVV